jgi:Protein of unknown function (DUF3592)
MGPRRGPVRTGGAPAVAVLVALFGVGTLVWGGLILLNDQRYAAAAGHAQGEIVDNVSHREGEDWIAYHVISFRTAEGRVVRFEAPQNDVGLFGGSHVGGRVKVAYDPKNPQDARVDTALRRWGTPAAVLLMGLVFVIAAVVVGGRGRRREKHQPQRG